MEGGGLGKIGGPGWTVALPGAEASAQGSLEGPSQLPWPPPALSLSLSSLSLGSTLGAVLSSACACFS